MYTVAHEDGGYEGLHGVGVEAAAVEEQDLDAGRCAQHVGEGDGVLRERCVGEIEGAGASLGPQRGLCQHMDDARVRHVLAGSAADTVQTFEFTRRPWATAEAPGAVEGLGLDALAGRGLVSGRACAGDGVCVGEIFCPEMDVAQAIREVERWAGLLPVPAAEHVGEQVAVRHGHLD